MTDTSTPYFKLIGIYVRESSCTLDENYNPYIGERELKGTFRVQGQEVTNIEQTFEDGEKKHFCTITTRFEFGYITTKSLEQLTSDNNEQPDFIASIMAKISIDYEIDNGDALNEELTKEWGMTNCLLQAWPYWREFCQSSQLRMNLPPMIIPLYRPTEDNFFAGQSESIESFKD